MRYLGGKRQEANPPVSPLERGEGKSKQEVHFCYTIFTLFSVLSLSLLKKIGIRMQNWKILFYYYLK